MNTFQLSCFAEVAATLNFSRAAKNLGVSQPAVSHQIKALEDELGATLVSRSTRTVALTDEGLQFLGYANDILDLAARGARLVMHRKETVARRIVVGTHGGIEALGLAPVLRALAASEPDLVPDVRMGPHSVMLDKLEGGSLDALLEFRDPSGAPAASTVFRRLGDTPVVCYCAPGHPFAAAGTVSLDELAGAGKVAICNPYTAAAAIDALQRQVVGYVGPDNAIMCANVEAATTLAAAGIAYVVVPCIPDLSKMGLVAVPLGGVDPLVFGVRVRRGRMTHALGAFVRALGTYVDEVANG